jgi:hypothetical protein
MQTRSCVAVALLLASLVSASYAVDAQPGTATEYSQHLGALSKLSVAVAEAMPPEQYAFRPDPGSMSFGEVMSHIAATNFAFCAGLKDSAPPMRLPPATRTKTRSSSSSAAPSTIAPPSSPI